MSLMQRAALLGGIAFFLCAAETPDAPPARLTGFPDDAAKAQLALESRFTESIDASEISAMLKELSARPHPGGSPAGEAVTNYIAGKFRSWGYDVKIETFYGLMSDPKERVVEMLAPYAYRPSLEERPVAGAPAQQAGDAPAPPYNVYSKDGEVTAPAVYVNYGLQDDYDLLAARGIDVKGKIVIVRMGRSYRGVKPRIAGEHGAVGAILYPDPADLGAPRGPVYPDGPFLPETAYNRGSVFNIPLIAGDPLTPGKGAIEKPASYSLDKIVDVISPIPVLPLSANDVHPILEAMTGEEVPAEWRGALPIAYRFGGTVQLHMKVEQNWRIASFHDVVAKLEGDTWPDEWIIHGNNHDSWGYGAMVALSGVAPMLEEARRIAELTKTGWRPKRSLLFTAWDGEELALIGSAEWVETHENELRKKAVAYINTGVNTRGYFSPGGSHSLETFINEVARNVQDPQEDLSVYERAKRHVISQGSEEERVALKASGRLRLEALGLGSDSTSFQHHLGIPTLDLGYQGEAPTGIYHSIYDNFDSFSRFGDPGFAYSRKLAETSGRAMLRLADAAILPFEFTGMADAISDYTLEIKTQVQDSRKHDAAIPEIDFTPLDAAVETLNASAARFVAARSKYNAMGASLSEKKLAKLNAKIARAEQALAPKKGLPRRQWYRHHIYAPGYDNGYGVKTIPSIREAAERGNWDEAAREVKTVAKLIKAYSARIDDASKMLEEAARS
ncbi:MAG TPA: transferrin receptor-like dimerization domain-containing protein [Parvularculaceae bacterium]|nr:M28 family peptidase [Amphiplicatus sp.]HPE31214.1 transferrin receptor-like dimerization domain-containing protein [Parvularculaceae bacterium]